MIYLDNSATTKQYDEVTELMYEIAKNNFGNLFFNLFWYEIRIRK